MGRFSVLVCLAAAFSSVTVTRAVQPEGPAEAAVAALAVNRATVEYMPGPSGGSSTGPFVMESNTVITRVVTALEFDPLLLTVDPQGTVAPGTRLTYVLLASNRSGAEFVSVIFRLPLDVELDDPDSVSGEISWPIGPVPTVQGSFDSTTRTAVWWAPSVPDGADVRLRVEVRVREDAPPDSVAVAQGSAVEGDVGEILLSNAVETPIVPPLLAVTKSADRPTASAGDAILFTLGVRHSGTDLPLSDATLVDRLPAALRYVPGSLRVEGGKRPDPEVSPDGSEIRIPLGPLGPGEARAVTLAARVAAGADRGDAVNRAYARAMSPGGASVRSPEAHATVRLTPGPFRQEGHLVGRVFVDDDGNGLPSLSEPGVPGVLVLLEDGRGAVTDVTGRWSLLGVRPGTHVLRLDPATLHESLVPVAAGAEWAENRRTRFVELRAATLAVADFPVTGESASRCEVNAGRYGLAMATGFPLDPADPRVSVWIDQAAAHLAALGVDAGDEVQVNCSGPGAREEADRGLSDALLGRIAKRARVSPPPGSPRNRPGSSAPAAAPATAMAEGLEEVVRSRPPIAAILRPLDGARAERESTQVDVTYPLGYTPDLRINGRPVDATAIGATSTLPSRGIAASRYVGVRLEPGRNRLEFRAIPSGSEYGDVSGVTAFVILPGPPVGLRIEVPETTWVADGATPGRFRVEAVDAGGVRVSENLVVTVDVEGGPFSEPDLDPDREGIQVRLERGTAELGAGPWISPGRVHLRAWHGEIDAETDVTVVPARGTWRVTGLVEGRLAGAGGVEGDGGLPPGLVENVSEDGGRLAALLTGPVGSASRLTVSVDTERERDRDRLFGPWEPEAFHPVAGDSSVEMFGAERQGPVFARLDGPWGFALYGDFATGFDRTELARYDRRLPGMAARAEHGAFTFQGFAASSDQSVVRDVFEPDGTSGPFLLRRRPIVFRSESVILESRDRYRSDLVVTRRHLRPDLDYTVDAEAGTILFRGPVAPLDRDLQPVRVVVVYETRSGGEDFAAGGVRFGVRRGERFEAGLSAVREGRQGDDFGLYGVDAGWRPRPGTHVRGELASSEDGGIRATASMFEARSRLGNGWNLEAVYRDVPVGFSNPTLLAAPEIGGRRAAAGAVWEPPGPWRAKGEWIWQEDERNGVERWMTSAETERRFQRATLLGALRRVHTSSSARGESDATVVEAGVRGRLSERWTAELVHRRSLDSPAEGYPDRTLAGVGFEVAPGRRLFLRQEWESGDGPLRDRTVAGMEASLTRNTKALAQYALEGGITGDAARASAGIETTLPLGPNSLVAFKVSRLQTTKGESRNDFTTLGGGWERRKGDALVATRYELYLGRAETRHLATASGIVRMSEPWSLFVRERLFVSDARSGPSATRWEGLFGAAYRPLGLQWQFLARLDHIFGGGRAGSPGGVSPGAAVSEPFGSVATVPRTEAPPGVGFVEPRLFAPALRDEASLHLAAGFRVDTRQRLAATWIVRLVGPDRGAGIDASLTDLLSFHYTVTVHPRWTLGASLRRFSQRETGTLSHGAGIEVGYLAWKDLWLLTGYNAAGFRDGGFPTRDRTDRGPFVAVRFKFDEMSLASLGELRLDRP